MSPGPTPIKPDEASAESGVWANRIYVALMLVATFVDAFGRENVPLRSLAVLLGIAMTVSLLWRRQYPFELTVATFGIMHVIKLSAAVLGVPWAGLRSYVGLIVLPYSLVRWATTTQIAIGLIVVLAGVELMRLDGDAWSEILVARVLLAIPAGIGAFVRLRAEAQARALERAKLLERAEIARELHDSVAHHVSAIVIQAQAGRTLAATQPAAAVAALEVIEEAAARSLTEMRNMVRALRQDAPAEMAPQPGVRDLVQFAQDEREGLPIDVQVKGDATDLEPSVDAAIYRMAQESVTNAVRHANAATQVRVRVEVDPTTVRLDVTDDGVLREMPGASGPASGSTAGYGLVGMAERASLLGGTFHAGPNPGRGWTVQAILPRKVRA